VFNVDTATSYNYFNIVISLLSVSRLCSVDDMIINEYGAVGGMIIGKRKRSTRIKPAAVPLVHHKPPT
jgi:hypothetical protein